MRAVGVHMQRGVVAVHVETNRDSFERRELGHDDVCGEQTVARCRDIRQVEVDSFKCKEVQLVASFTWRGSVVLLPTPKSRLDSTNSISTHDNRADSFEHVSNQTCSTLNPNALDDARGYLLNACQVDLNNLTVPRGALISNKSAESADPAECELSHHCCTDYCEQDKIDGDPHLGCFGCCRMVVE